MYVKCYNRMAFWVNFRYMIMWIFMWNSRYQIFQIYFAFNHTLQLVVIKFQNSSKHKNVQKMLVNTAQMSKLLGADLFKRTSLKIIVFQLR